MRREERGRREEGGVQIFQRGNQEREERTRKARSRQTALRPFSSVGLGYIFCMIE